MDIPGLGSSEPDRTFTDPFTGEVLDDPESKTYRVTYRIQEFGVKETYISTLAENKLTKDQAKEKILKRPTHMGYGKQDLTIRSIARSD